MDKDGSIVEFFYNIVPGSLFILLLKLRYSLKMGNILNFEGNQEVLIIFIFIILSLFLGFLFQSITKFVRSHFGWNYNIFNKVKNEDKYRFLYIYNEIYNEKIKDIEEISPKKLQDTFYDLDNYLRGIHPAFLPTHFSSRFAFWSNIGFSLLILLIIDLLVNPNCLYIYLLTLFVFISFYFANQYFFGFYNSVIRTFFMERLKQQKNK